MSENKINPEKGLHLCEQKRAANHLGYMAERSHEILEHFDALLRRTYDCAPIRNKCYRLVRDGWQCLTEEKQSERLRERLLEQAIWKQWKNGTFMPPLCCRIQTYQMPLRGAHTDESWGMIDLVGVAENGLPVILELKKEKSVDTPLGILVEALAYAIAVKKAWNDKNECLRNQWKNHVLPKSEFPSNLSKVPIIGVAPADYWERKKGNRGKQDKVPLPAWEPFKKLCDACADHGYPVNFLQFTTEEKGQGKLPKIQKVSGVNLPGF